jgi:hypothetical protein
MNRDDPHRNKLINKAANYSMMVTNRLSINIQQQLSLLSQASWGRLEMNPQETRVGEAQSTGTQKHKRKRKDHVSGTLIASLQALLSITNSLGMSHSLSSLDRLIPS